MVVDSSALLAILFDESERTRFISAIGDSDQCYMSVANFLETSIVIEARFGEEGTQLLDSFLLTAEIELLAVTVDQVNLARQGFRRFGKGRHKAALNFGDCFAYALAQALDMPLLCKGEDFLKTDVKVWAP